MAIYPYKCSQCGSAREVVQSIASYCKSPIRPECCARTMDRVISVPMIAPDTFAMNSFVSHVDGSVITSRSQLKEHNIRNGVVAYDEVQGEAKMKRAEQAKAIAVERKADIIEAVKMADAGYVPHVAKVNMDSPKVESVNVLEGVT